MRFTPQLDNSVGIYIHIPFCVRKCAYCDFASLPEDRWDDTLMRRYTDAVAARVHRVASRQKKLLPADTIYIGGGTPSLLKIPQISHLLSVIGEHFLLDPSAEISLESNPGTLDRKKLHHLVETGINRLSIGMQSIRDKSLHILGRIHDRKTGIAMFTEAKKAGFSSINLDFIYGIPGQTPKDWQRELTEILTILSPDHFSMYSLIPELGTKLGDEILSGKLDVPGEEEQAEMMEITHNLLVKAGYEHYEISNFARPGHACRHNLKYWQGDDYLGFGSSAHSFRNNRRYASCIDPIRYMNRIKENRSVTEFSERLPMEKRMGEYMIMILRLSEGVSSKDFETRFHCSLEDVYGETIQNLKKQGLLKTNMDNSSSPRYFIPPDLFPLQSEIAKEFLV